jgi:multicomponent Na+:H+ antiporter subunit D
VLLIPLLSPFLAAIISLFFWRRPVIQQWIFMMGSAAMLGGALSLLSDVQTNGVQYLHVGGWEAPFGITLVADLLSSLLLVVVAIISIAVGLYAQNGLDRVRKSYGYFPIMMLMFFGVAGSLMAGDVFNLYVWFEVMLMSSFVLLTLGASKPQLEGAIKYVTINVIASAFFLTGVGVLYGIAGTLNMANLARILPEVPEQGLVVLASVFFMLSFGLKSAVFPLFFWLPASYATPPIAISAPIAGLLTKIGMYTLLRFFTLIFPPGPGTVHWLLLVIAGLSMLIGSLGAIAQNDYRKVFSFSIISQIGYMLMGLALHTPLAIAGAIFFLIHNMLVKTNLFFIGGLVYVSKGSYRLPQLGNMSVQFPLVSIMFFISGFALSGLPPLSGFWGKWILAQAGFADGQFTIVAISLLVGILSFYYVLRVWLEVFWKKSTEEIPGNALNTQLNLLQQKPLLVLPVAGLTLLILALSFYAGPVLELSTEAAGQLLQREVYIQTILNGVADNQ